MMFVLSPLAELAERTARFVTTKASVEAAESRERTAARKADFIALRNMFEGEMKVCDSPCGAWCWVYVILPLCHFCHPLLVPSAVPPHKNGTVGFGTPARARPATAPSTQCAGRNPPGAC